MSSGRLHAVHDIGQVLGERLPGGVREGTPLASLTTYRLGGPAAVLVEARGPDDLASVAGVLREQPDVPLLVVGRGSNLLVSDEGFPGVVLLLGGAFEAMSVEPSVVRAGGAVALPVLARRAAARGLAGLEFFVGIPGAVGGAVRMNAGGHGRQTSEVLREAVVVDLRGDGRPRSWSLAQLALSYRSSALAPSQIVIEASFAVSEDQPAVCAERIAEIVRWRRANQPGGANGGSVFRNPEGVPAGAVIEQCGLKGLRVGGAEVSRLHANFIQAHPGATAADVVALMREVRRRVGAATGIWLEPEVHLVGLPWAGDE